MLFGQLGMLFEFFLIIIIRNPLELVEMISIICVVRFEVLRPLTCLQSFDGGFIKRLLFSCDNFFFLL